MADWPVRPAREADLHALAALWHAAWHEAHGHLLPPELVAIRTLEHLTARAALARDALRVAGPEGAPLGFHLCHGAELEQFYLAPDARGSGLAAALLRDAEARIAATGVPQAWLACAIGNERASRFYSREGWTRAETALTEVAGATPDAPFPLKVWIHRKALA